MATAGAGALMYVLGIVEWRRAVSASNDIEAGGPRRPAFDPATCRSGASRPRRCSGCSGTCWARWPSAAAPASGIYGQPPQPTSETTTWRDSLAPTLAPNQGGATLRITF